MNLGSSVSLPQLFSPSELLHMNRAAAAPVFVSAQFAAFTQALVVLVGWHAAVGVFLFPATGRPS